MLAFAILVTLQFHYDASEFVNAVYHVSCLTGRLPCSNPVYTKFWTDVMHRTPRDGAQFNRWSAIFDRAENAAPNAPRAELLPNYASFYPSIRVRQNLVSTAMQAGSPERFRKRAEAIVGAADAAALAEVLAHTVRRLHPWYIDNAPPTRARLKLVHARVRENGTVPLIAGIARFVRADFSARDVWVHAVPSPAPKQTDASATAVRNHVLIEITDDMKPEAAASIALHELTHALYDSAPQADHLKLMGQFAATKHPTTPALYGLVNEAIATGIQLLLYERQGVDDKDAYRHPYIPRVGRSTMPLLKRAIGQRATMLDEFVPAYIEAAEKELKSEIAAPRFQLLTAGVLASVKNKTASDSFFETFRPVGACSSEEELERYDMLSAVRLLTYDEQDPHLNAVPDLSELSKNRGFAYRLPPAAAKRPTYILAGRDTADLVDVVKEFARISDTRGEGLLLKLD